MGSIRVIGLRQKILRPQDSSINYSTSGVFMQSLYDPSLLSLLAHPNAGKAGLSSVPGR